MFEFISRFAFGKNHEEVKNRAVLEVAAQLSGLTEESKKYVSENYAIDIDEHVEERSDRTRNKNMSIIYITLEKK